MNIKESIGFIQIKFGSQFHCFCLVRAFFIEMSIERRDPFRYCGFGVESRWDELIFFSS